ncbi:helix-turn-helix transcriptional regulator [Listeria monocytogenes]|nr:XRE family transcriptional regulator [Listeria monocytogenes]EKZ7015207.1 helix-turn-helix transcriptional regulator [Listeria monocytogenes]
MINTKSIGERIRDIRISLGLTMEEFGKQLYPPATKGTISKWENGKYLPNRSRLTQIAELGKVDTSFLIGGLAKDFNKVKLEKYNFMLKHFPESSQIGIALRSFDRSTTDKILNLALDSAILVSFDTDNNGLSFEEELCSQIEDKFNVAYLDKIKTNSNLIKKIIDNNDPNDVLDYPVYSNEEQYATNNNMFFYVTEVEHGIEPKLIKELETILEDMNESLNKLLKKYPDQPSKRVTEVYCKQDENEMEFIASFEKEKLERSNLKNIDSGFLNSIKKVVTNFSNKKETPAIFKLLSNLFSSTNDSKKE